MSDLGGRPLTVITAATLRMVMQLQNGVIVARRSRCGRYITFQAATRDDAELARDVGFRRAIVVADREDVETYTRTFGADAGDLLRRHAMRGLAERFA